jgi:predicted PurR-regulated permease PerM
MRIADGRFATNPLIGSYPMLRCIARNSRLRRDFREAFLEFIRSAGERRFPLVITDPQPLEKVGGIWQTASRIATIGIFAILAVFALEHARPILLPTVSAFVVGIMLGPLSSLAGRVGIPTIVSAIVLWLLVLAMFYGLILLLSAPIVEFVGQGPQLGGIIKEKLQVLDRPMAALRDLHNAVFPTAGEKEEQLSMVSVLQPVLTIITPALGQMIVFFGTLFFFLLGRARVRHFLVAFFDERSARLRMLRILNDVEHNLTSYLSVITIINCVVGLGAGLIAFAVGLPNPLVWGVLGFILNFVPYLGALLMELVLFAVGLVIFPTLGHALIAPVLYLMFNILEGQLITPAIMGKRLQLNPLTVFLALVFWTWLWGPVGAFLAVPIVIVVLVAINHLFPKDDAVLPE